MARDENRGAAFGHVCDERTEDVAPDDGVESVRRLVQHEQIAALRQREQNHQLRFLTLGQTTEEMLAVELETLDQILRPRAIPPRIEGRLEMDRVAHVVFAPSSVSRARCNSASETPERRASASSLRTSATACCERSRALRPGASSRTNVPAP